MQKVKKAIIPAAGFGTRVLPATKSIPKEMLPIVDKPSIHYIVEEAVASGIEEILIITGRGKQAMEDYFDRTPELEEALAKGGKTAMLESVVAPAKLAKIHFLRQQQMKGLGHAVLCAKTFVGNEPFVVLYADDVILGGEAPASRELIDAYEKYGRPCCAIKEVPKDQIFRYSSLKVEPIGGRSFRVTDMVEKPKTPEEAFSCYSILGRVLLTPDVFDILEKTAPGAGGEIQLTDAMAEFARRGGMTGVDFSGARFDMGSKLGIIKANIEMGLVNPETSAELKEFIKETAAKL